MTAPRLSTWQWALLASVVLHGALLGVRLVAPQALERVQKDSPLDVILVNARPSEEAPPQHAQAIAQYALSGGGEADRGRSTSPLPSMDTDEIGDSQEQLSASRLQSMEQQQLELLTQLKAELSTPANAEPVQNPLTAAAPEQEEKRRQRLKLLAEIERRISAENARPKRRYLSPATQVGVQAVYYDKLRRAIEERGTQHFPTTQGKKLYGALTMIVTVDHSGKVLDTEVVDSSGIPELDRQARAIAQSAGSFGEFPPAMRREMDQILVVSRFTFTREQTLEAKVSSAP